MITIKKVWMTGCEPCKKVENILSEVQEEFTLVDYNIDMSSPFKDRKAGKALLTKFATDKVPFLLFVKEDGEAYAAHYAESGLPTIKDIEEKIKNGN